MMIAVRSRLLISVLPIALSAAACSRNEKSVSAVSTGITEAEAFELAAEASDSAVQTDSEGFRPLRLRDFQQFSAQPNTWREEQGVIATTGQPKGYIHSKRTYENFTWRAEFRLLPGDDASKTDQSNTGFMLCIQEPHKVWPRSLEVQGKWVEMASIKSNGGVPALMINDDQATREAARKPVGEWNAIEITVNGGAVSSTLNGKAICIAEPGELKSGSIGLQSELFPVEFRNMKIREE